MQEREEAKAWLIKEFGEDNFRYDWYDSDVYLQHCIKHGKFQYGIFFRNSAWTDETIDLYADYLKENNIVQGPLFGMNRVKMINAYLERDMLNNILCMSFSPSIWNDDLTRKFSDKIGNANIDPNLLNSASFLFVDSPIVLKAIIESKRFDLVEAFGESRRNAWTDENKKLFARTIAGMVKEGNEDIPQKYFSRTDVYVELLKEGVYKYASFLSFDTANNIIASEEYKKVFLDAAPMIVRSGNSESNYLRKLFELPEVYIELIKNGVYDKVFLISGMIRKNEIYDSDDNVDTLINAFNAIEDSKDKRTLYGHKRVLENNKYLKKVLALDDKEAVKNYLYGIPWDAWTEEDVKVYVDKHLNNASFVAPINTSSYALKLVLERDDFSEFFIFFKPSAWSKENIFNCFDKSLDNDERFVHIQIDDPYYLYLYNSYIVPVRKVLSIVPISNYELNENTLKDVDLLYSLGEKVVKGEISYEPKVNKFLSFIYETKSDKVIYLMRDLIEDDLNNIDKIFNEDGMTSYLFNNLIFDSDFRKYCNGNNIDYFSNCSSKVHLQYLSFVSKYPAVCEKVIISLENVDEYFDENGVKQSLLDKLFKPSCMDILLKIDEEMEYPKLSEKKLFVLNKLKEIDNEKIKGIFFNHIVEKIDGLDEKRINALCDLVRRIEYSNASEIRSFSEIFVKTMLDRENPEAELIEIEKIFVQDKIPFVGKIYQVFKKLYPNYKGISTSDRMSPTLKNMDHAERDRIIFNDLLRIELGSNNRNLQQYLVSFFNANMFYEMVRDGKRTGESFSQDELKKMNTYYERVCYLCENFLDLNFQIDNSLSVWDKINYVENKLREYDSNFTSIPNYLVSRICKGSGFNSLMDMIAYSIYKPQQMDELHRQSVNSKFTLEKGDYVKGIRSLSYLPNILQNGSVAAEFLGDSSNSDLTPLDTDLSLVTKDGSISEALGSTVANNYGPIYVVIKGNNTERLEITRNDSGEHVQNDLSKIELFRTGAVGNGHYGIRTGFASSEIDYIIASDDYDKIGFEIALNGIYIPVVDKNGNLKFTVEDFDRVRRQMSGLSHYGEHQFIVSDNLENDEILEISKGLRNSEKNAKIKREAILGVVSEVLSEHDLSLKTKLDDNLVHGTMEFFDTGSTGRGTNVADDSDFDFIVRVDRDLLFDENKMNSIREDLAKRFGKSCNGDFRLSDVYIDGVDDPLKIDMTFVVKTNKLDYATESCIQDRLTTIKDLYPKEYDLIVANIVFAKKFLKEAGCYKPKHAGDNPQGGLGGVGTENWILQHGGSFYDAAVDFVQMSALYPNLSEFREHYPIQDFGKNHMAEKRGHYPYDNFVYNLNEEGFEKMKLALGQYVSSKNLQKDVVSVSK